MTTATSRRCIGSQRYGIEPHEAPVEDFPTQPSQKDGLGRMCKLHWNQYTAGLARDAKARKAGTPDEAETVKHPAETSDAPRPRRRIKGIADGTAAQRAEHIELERQLEAVGGAETDEGQAILERAATKAAEARVGRKGANAAEPIEEEGEAA